MQQGPNRNINPQYRRLPLQLLKRERKFQQDQVQPPLYIEDDPEDCIEDALKIKEN